MTDPSTTQFSLLMFMPETSLTALSETGERLHNIRHLLSSSALPSFTQLLCENVFTLSFGLHMDSWYFCTIAFPLKSDPHALKLVAPCL